MIERGLAWTILLAVVVGMPLVGLAISVGSPSLGHTVTLTGAFGMLATVVMALIVLLVSRSKGLTRLLGVERTHDLHRKLGVLAVGFLAAHIVAATAHSPRGLGMLNPFLVGLPIKLGIFAFLAILVGAAVLPLARFRRYALRARVHALLGLSVLGLVVAHVLTLHDALATPLVAIPVAVLTASLVAVLGWRWIVAPVLDRGAHVVSAVRPEASSTSTLVLKPAGPRRDPAPEPGQFVWLRLRRHPAITTEHPFTIAAAHRNGAIELTVRDRGPYSGGLHQLRPGRRVWIDGPHGSFVPTPPITERRGDVRDRALVLVAGGIGITPIMSILRSHAASTDPRRHRLLLAERADDALFAEEIRRLARSLDLAVTRTGGQRLDLDMVRALLPDSTPARHDYFVCGPPALVGPTLQVLEHLGVPARRIHTERFG